MREEKTNILRITTPEGISFALPLAGPVTRFLAWAIDLICISVITGILSNVLSVFGMLSPDLISAVLVVIYFGTSIGYGILLEWYWRGQTLGKRLLKLRVVEEHGLRLQFSQVVVRNLLRFVDSLPLFYLVGGVACVVSRRAQRLGDYAANTIVVHIGSGFKYDLGEAASDKFNSFRDYPNLEARLRQCVSPEEAALALQALFRREELDAGARLDLFNDFATHFQALVEFPEEATLGLTDEQYTRNVVDSLFQAREK
jgi:uncharacterized RDD family membrane protein YckC